MRKSLIILCVLVMTFSLFESSAQDYFSKINLKNRVAGFQAIYNSLQSQGQTGLIKGWWRFDEASGNLIDYSGNNNALTPSGSPTYRQADYLGLARAILFDKTNPDYFKILAAEQTGLDMGTDKDLIILVIFKSSTNTDHQSFVSRYGTGRYELRIYYPNGCLWSFLAGAGGNTGALIGPIDVTDGNWHLAELRVDRDSSTGMYMFLDGEREGGTKDPTGVGDMTDAVPLWIGATNDSTCFMDGCIAEVMVMVDNLPDYVLSDDFALFAYNQALGYPLNLPRKIKKSIQ